MHSCSITYKDEFYIYGGKNNRRKISKLDCNKSEVRVMGKLKFDFFNGTCTTNNEFVFLCFSNENAKQCYKSVSALPTKWWTWFTYAPKTKFNHKAGTIAASSGNLEIPISKRLLRAPPTI